MAEDQEQPELPPPENRTLYIFGRDVSKIPCFRNTFLYGAGGGFVAGLASFMATSRGHLSANVGVATFCTTTMIYWFHCRYNWSKTKFQYSQLRAAMKKQAIYEGTDLERELEERAKSA